MTFQIKIPPKNVMYFSSLFYGADVWYSGIFSYNVLDYTVQQYTRTAVFSPHQAVLAVQFYNSTAVQVCTIKTRQYWLYSSTGLHGVNNPVVVRG